MTPDSRIEVLCAGIVVADAIASPVDELPESGRLALVDSVQLHTGGCALSTASALARLGISTALCGCVGDDLFGAVLVREAEARGIDTSAVRVTDAQTSASVVLDATDGERTFLHNPGASGALTADHVQRALADSAAPWLHIGGALVLPALDGEPLGRLLADARERGTLTSLDPVHDATGAWHRVHPCLPHLVAMCPNLTEARGITGERTPERCAAWLHERGVQNVAIKMGRDGAYASSGGAGRHVEAFAVEAKDETGAGDAFAGGFVFGLLRGWSVEEAVRLGNAVGALSTTKVGGSTALPDLEEALAMAGLEGAAA